MRSIKKGIIYFALLTVLLSLVVQEAEGRRLVLRGRRTITRTYYSPSIFPAWLIIVFVALGEILFGVVLFFVLRKFVLLKDVDAPTNSYQPALMEEPDSPN